MLELMLDLLDRAARGFLFALPAAIFWFAALCFRKRRRTAQHMGLSLVFQMCIRDRLLHWMHFAESQVGTATATPRFS